MAPAIIRRLTAHDAPSFAAAVERARDAGELLASSDPHAAWTVRSAGRDPDQAAVAEADGRIVGFVLPEGKALVVDPSFRRLGVGRALVEAGLAIERGRGRPNLLLGVLPDEPVGHAFLEASGFAFQSNLWDLELPPGAPVPPPAWPAGVGSRPIDHERDVERWVALFNAAFADHATPLQLDPALTAADWTEWPARDEDLVLIEDHAGELLGFCATEPRRRPDGGVEPRAEIWTIGVRPERQGGGLGRQLLRWGVGHLRELGVETVVLSVNGRNPRALGLYESDGFVRVSTRERWARPVDAPA